MGKGQISKAVRIIHSNGVADIEEPGVKEQLLSKHPPRGMDLPERVPRGSPVANLRGLKKAMLALRRLGSPGTGGLRPEYLHTLAKGMEPGQLLLLEDLGLRYLNGGLPAWFYRVFLTSQTVPL